jgi:hypothetical protein
MHDRDILGKEYRPQPAQDLCGQASISRVSPRKMLLQQAEEFRRRAHALEAVAYHLPENMPQAVEETLANTIAAGLYR